MERRFGEDESVLEIRDLEEARRPRLEAWRDLITRTSGVRSGKPCIIGTRITVSDVLEYLASGMSQAVILMDFPQLRPEHIQAVLHSAAERAAAPAAW